MALINLHTHNLLTRESVFYVSVIPKRNYLIYDHNGLTYDLLNVRRGAALLFGRATPLPVGLTLLPLTWGVGEARRKPLAWGSFASVIVTRGILFVALILFLLLAPNDGVLSLFVVFPTLGSP